MAGFAVSSGNELRDHAYITLSVPNGCNLTTNFGSIFLNDVTIFPHEFFIVGIVGTDISHSGF